MARKKKMSIRDAEREERIQVLEQKLDDVADSLEDVIDNLQEEENRRKELEQRVEEAEALRSELGERLAKLEEYNEKDLKVDIQRICREYFVLFLKKAITQLGAW